MMHLKTKINNDNQNNLDFKVRNIITQPLNSSCTQYIHLHILTKLFLEYVEITLTTRTS